MFFNSINDTRTIVKNYRKAVNACKSALKSLTQVDTASRVPSSSGIVRCTINKDTAKRVWQEQLNSLTDENEMRRMVDAGNLNLYIFDTIKREVFNTPTR
jgi:hypothetical protein